MGTSMFGDPLKKLTGMSPYRPNEADVGELGIIVVGWYVA